MRDVKDVARALRGNGFNVTLITNVTRNAFKQAFGRFFHKYGRNKTNRLFFYYAGHGHTQKMYTGHGMDIFRPDEVRLFLNNVEEKKYEMLFTLAVMF